MDQGAAIIGVWVAIAVVGCTWAIAWAIVRVSAANAKVKQDMLARGFSVEEMQRLLNPPVVWTKPVKRGSAEEDLGPLLDRELTTDEIERLLKLLPGCPPLSVEDDVVPLLDREVSVDDIERLLTLRRSLTNEAPPADGAPAATERQTGFKSAEPRSSL